MSLSTGDSQSVRRMEDGTRQISSSPDWDGKLSFAELNLKVDCAGCYFCSSWSSSGAGG